MALFFTVLLGISVSILGYFLNEFNESSLIREVELGIDSNIGSFEDWHALAFDLVDASTVLDNMHRTHPGSWYVYYGPDGRVRHKDIVPPERDITTLAEGIILFDLKPDQVLRLDPIETSRTVAAKVHTLNDGSRLLVARDIESALESRRLMRQLGLVTILMMLAVIGTSFFISTYVVGLINKISRTTRQIMVTGDLSRRIEVNTTWDDLGNLAALLNEMLRRIEELLQGVRRVADNIAHDLRTPLSRLRNHMEVMQRNIARTGDEELSDSARELIAEADHLLQTFNALLRISNIESGKRHSQFSPCSLDELLEDLVELYTPVAEEQGIEIEFSSMPIQIVCDRDLLFQAIANVLDNAIKFAPLNSTISVRATARGDRVGVEIADQGEGIDDEEKPKVFTRFYRAEHSRNAPGNGLGLALVAAVVELHRGRIDMLDNHPGLRVVMDLPGTR